MAIENAGERGTGTRLLLVRADGCVLCMSLDAVLGVYAYASPFPDENFALPGGHRVPVVRWTTVSGVRGASAQAEPRWMAVVQTPAGPVALAAQECLGVRAVSFVESPPVPTHLADANGSPLCYVLVLDQQPCFLIEPKALCRAIAAQGPSSPDARASGPAAESGGERVVLG